MGQHTTESLISEVGKVVTPPYSEWKIGLANNANFDSEGYMNICLFSPENNMAVISAYNHFVGQGMVGKPPFLTDAKYLYLYKIDGGKYDVFF